MKVLVTGGGGFIGSHTVARLVGDGHDVRCLDNFETGFRTNLAEAASAIELIEGDVRSYREADRATRGCEVVIHLAALPSVPRSIKDPLTTAGSNVIGTLNILLAARDNGARRVVFGSSSSVYGTAPGLPRVEDLPVLPISPYAVGKLAGEGYCRSFSELQGLETVSLRYFNVFGPRQDPLSQYAAVIPKFILAALSRQPLTVFGDGEQSRDFTYVENVVEANLLAMAGDGVAGLTLNVACGDRVTINQLIEQLRLLTGWDIKALHGDARGGDIRHSWADVSRAREKLGFKPTVRFEEGLARTLADLESRTSPGDGRLLVRRDPRYTSARPAATQAWSARPTRST